MTRPIAQRETYSAENLPKELFDELEAYILKQDDKEGSLIHVLHKAQQIFGYLPKEVQLFVARKLGVPGAKVFGVVSFYSYFTTNPVGEHMVSVCMGTACFVRGAEKIVDDLKEKLGVESGGTTEDNKFTLKDVRCVGACGLAPVVLVDDDVYGRVELSDIDEILSKYGKVDGDGN